MATERAGSSSARGTWITGKRSVYVTFGDFTQENSMYPRVLGFLCSSMPRRFGNVGEQKALLVWHILWSDSISPFIFLLLFWGGVVWVIECAIIQFTCWFSFLHQSHVLVVTVHGWHHRRCMNGWMWDNCKAIWMKALYKCNPVTIMCSRWELNPAIYHPNNSIPFPHHPGVAPGSRRRGLWSRPWWTPCRTAGVPRSTWRTSTACCSPGKTWSWCTSSATRRCPTSCSATPTRCTSKQMRRTRPRPLARRSAGVFNRIV